MQMDPIHFQFFVDFLEKTSGYHLTPEKKYLLETRMDEVLKAEKLNTVQDIVSAVQKDNHGQVANCVIEAMTVNETFFFRDDTPFKLFEAQILPQLAQWGQHHKVRIWSAASSTGQEAYSVAMLLEENKDTYPNLSYEIIGTDINNRVLAKARQGVYSDLEVNRGLPEKLRSKYFKKAGSHWELSDAIRRRVDFRQLNLRKQYNLTGQFDFVLLRNVLIYFEKQMKEEILHKVSALMRPDGFLMLGAAEGIYDPEHIFRRCQEVKGLYRHTPASAIRKQA